MSGGGTTVANWGAAAPTPTSPADMPVAGDYDGDGKTDITVFRPSTGTWYGSRSGGSTAVTNWGAYGDVPVGQPQGT